MIQDLQELIRQDKFAAAATSGDQSLDKQPQNVSLQFLTAYAYQMDQQMDKAKVLYERLIKNHPDLPEPRNNLAMIYLAQGDSDKASQLLIDALHTHSSYSTAYNNLGRIYRGIASEAYRQAVSESNQSRSAIPNMELVALSDLSFVDALPTIELAAAPTEIAVTMPATIPTVEPSRVEAVIPSAMSGALSDSNLADSNLADSNVTDSNTGNTPALLRQQVKDWAQAWQQKQIDRYISFYVSDHRPDFETHSAWVAHRKARIMRPGDIRIGVRDIKFRAQGKTQAIIDFEQSYNSPNYSDKVIKRLSFRLVGSTWKIFDERVISIL